MRSPKPRRVPCRVESYSGARADETPRLVHCRGRDLPVKEVLDRRRVKDSATGRITDEFTVRLTTGTARLRRGPSGRWTMVPDGREICGQGS